MNKYNRVYNFAAGPATLPVEVLEEVKSEMLNYNDTGMSVMEMSHRSKMFDDIIHDAESNLRKLLNIPSNYKVLFLQGGGSTQFAMIPIHFLSKKAAYINTGHWSNAAIKEAKKYGEVYVAASSEKNKFSYIPDCSDLSLDGNDYLYYCDNNTIYGTKFKDVPNSKGLPLIWDLSSCTLSASSLQSNILKVFFSNLALQSSHNVSKYGLIFAGAQKNIGPAGVTVVIIREDLIKETNPLVPTMLQYKVHSDKNSMHNTPPTYNIYVCGKVFEHILKTGGLIAMEKRNQEKAAYLYDYLDSNDFYKPLAQKEYRSLMNVVFTTGNEELDKKFVLEAAQKGLVNLKGHKVLGGLRASIYNSMPLEGVYALVEFMKCFKEKNNVQN